MCSDINSEKITSMYGEVMEKWVIICALDIGLLPFLIEISFFILAEHFDNPIESMYSLYE